ncbi:MAG TPA: 30S ribosomal protein S12 methylthiotransferase RimO [Candidatus Sulfotelmatobacter sp.]|nr:30S ribosomal protein S12 methylthiotransferase RimO [Candidatus Sulfotelmatobacter sp.]
MSVAKSSSKEQQTTGNARPLRVGLISLGCAKNLVDGEIMLGSLLKDGIQITNDAAQADALIVNTCSFIDSAQEESVDAILESAEVREARNRGQSLIVSGCLPQRFREELPKLLPEVDAFMGIDQVTRVSEIVKAAIQKRAEKVNNHRPGQKQSSKAKIVGRFAELDKGRITGRPHSHDTGGQPADKNSKLTDGPLLEVHNRPTFIPDFATPRFRLTPKHFAYVKIAEGCNHPCSFCIIPRMRGSHRSRGQLDIVAEVKALVADGVKEINLISQDSTYYGLDLRPNHSRTISSPEKFSAAARSLPAEATTICSLLRELNAIEGDFWIRLLYTHPAHWTDDLIATIGQCKKVARYVDIPLQHIHENMLERMRRETSQQYICDLIRRIRAGVPGIALRTTFIVGFPGETERYFETLLDFIHDVKFERLGVFVYSREEGTRAGAMAGQIPDQVKQQRRKIAMAEQRKIAQNISQAFVGREIKVLVEGRADARQLEGANISSWEHGFLRGEKPSATPLTGRFLVARGEADAPDIDGRVFIRGRAPVGEFARVKIIGHTDYDLIAQPV